MITPTPLPFEPWLTVARLALSIAMLVYLRSRPPADPLQTITDRLRHPIRWAVQHPILSVRRRTRRGRR